MSYDLVTLTQHVYYLQLQVPKLGVDTMKAADWYYALTATHSIATTLEMTEFIGDAPNIVLSGMFVSYSNFKLTTSNYYNRPPFVLFECSSCKARAVTMNSELMDDVKVRITNDDHNHGNSQVMAEARRIARLEYEERFARGTASAPCTSAIVEFRRKSTNENWIRDEIWVIRYGNRFSRIMITKCS